MVSLWSRVILLFILHSIRINPDLVLHDENPHANPFLFSVGNTTCKLGSFEYKIKRAGGWLNKESSDNKSKKQEKDGKVYDDSVTLMMSTIHPFGRGYKAVQQ